MQFLKDRIFEQLMLMEDRIQFLKDKEKDLNTDHDPYAEHKKPHDIIDHFATHGDPSKNKQHTQWIIHQYKKGHIRQEDHPRIKEALSNFDKYKGKLANKDLNSYKHISDVEDVVEPHLGKHASKKQETKQVKDEGSEVIHRGDDGAVVRKIKTKEAACHYGAGTKWCTAADKNNMFDHYNKNGPLYIIHHKDGSKHQIHFESGQSMDEKDHPISPHSIIKKSPSLRNVKEFKGKHPAFDTHEEQIAKIEKGDDPRYSIDVLDNKEIPSSTVGKALDAKDADVRHAAINHPNATKEHISKALNDENAAVRWLAIHHPNATHEHISKALNDEDKHVRRHAIEHPNATSEHISKALNDEDKHVRLAAIKHPNATSEHISKALNDEDPNVRRAAIKHPKATPEHISKAVNDEDKHVRLAAIKHPNATPEHISKALNDEDVDVRRAAIRHPKITPEHISKALDDEDADVRYYSIKHPKATPEHISKALNDKAWDVRQQAIRHPKATPEHISKALNDKNPAVRRIAFERMSKKNESYIPSFKEWLMEDRIQFLKDKEKDLNTDHDPYAEHKKPHDIIDHFSNHADPSKNKQHTQWIIHQYKKGHVRQEDHPRIKEALTNFDKYKGKLQNKDLNSYKHISDVEDAVEPHLGKHASKRQETKQVKDEGSEVIHRGEDGAVVRKIKTKEAACHYGAGTKWCTAADKNNMFDSYNKNGPLYIVHHKDGSRHQIHFESGQSMDEKDRPETLHNIVDKSPSLKHVKEFKGKHPAFDTHEEQIAKIEKGDDPKYSIDVLKNNKKIPSSTIGKALNDKNPAVRQHAIKHPNATHEHISKALNDEDPNVRQEAIEHPNATPEHISKALDDEDADVRRAAIKHPKATPEHISKALNDKDAYVRWAAIEHPKATHEHISKALNDKDVDVRWAAIKHPKATPEHISKALNDKDVDVRRAAIEHPKATHEHISKALNDKVAIVRWTAIEHPNATKEHISKAVNDEDSIVRLAAIKHPKATSEHISKALNDKDADVRQHAINHPKATPEHISKALDDEDPNVRRVALKHPKATPEHISKALDDMNYNVRHAAIHHPNATSEHISKALNDKVAIVRWTAIEHPNATPEHISKALNDEHADVRRIAIEHPKATPEHISKALNDENADVRRIASERMSKKNESYIPSFKEWLLETS